MKNRRMLLTKFYESLFVYIIIYCVLINLLARFVWQGGDWYKDLILILVFAAHFIIRQKVKNFFVYLILHILILATPLLYAQGVVEIIIYFIITAAFTAFSYVVYFRPFNRIDLMSLFVFEAFLAGDYFVAAYFNLTHAQTAIYIVSFAMVILYFIYYHNNNVVKSLEDSMKSQPVEKILKSNNRLIALFTIVLAGFISLSPFVPVRAFLSALWQAFLKFTRFVFSFQKTPEAIKYAEDAALKPMYSAKNPLFMIPTGEPSRIVSIIQDTIYYILSAASILIIIALICFIVYAFYRRFKFFAGIKNAGDIEESINTKDDVSFFEANPILNVFNSMLNMFDSSIEHKIRKIYFKHVQKNIKRGIEINSSETPSEIAMKTSGEELNRELVKIYEKARYNSSCSKEDLAQAQKIAKALEKY